ncbi:ubiquinol-cytochrome C chaperone family protein [Aquisalinus flavus]|uniref:Ubiquinol-cytochrome c chaperone n=1 Tax=Aquisalinus flavus TaxID=1526572 RepID=A0A8J2Y6H4_9PROT|nr:ubiquinol-cytochrome C chaperone family protein [Aquisalinus flavus]MBD0427696.1 ubiquinol-cytochrome C chaperone [Aquisalinus flavus]UNE47475.1 ubiquinol-cytochrome C chaperone [Aquisalinus flavus]GGD03096.1 ubiquinol-cytochrome c chaperone [Aquisalinus flavus]
MLSRFFKKDRTRDRARELYRDIIVQARKPAFYEAGVPDTVDGRFDMICLHMFLVMRRLKPEEGRTSEFSQALFDVMFKNMDDSLREMGVGDLIVGKRVRKLAEDFYGRINAYDRALNDEEESALADALSRNILGLPGDEAEAREVAQPLAAYVRQAAATLGNQKVERLMLGFVSFPEPAMTGATA